MGFPDVVCLLIITLSTTLLFSVNHSGVFGFLASLTPKSLLDVAVTGPPSPRPLHHARLGKAPGFYIRHPNHGIRSSNYATVIGGREMPWGSALCSEPSCCLLLGGTPTLGWKRESRRVLNLPTPPQRPEPHPIPCYIVNGIILFYHLGGCLVERRDSFPYSSSLPWTLLLGDTAAIAVSSTPSIPPCKPWMPFPEPSTRTLSVTRTHTYSRRQ
jgi:hypothetical protein